MSADLSRRTFVASTTAATLVSAPGILSAQGANSKINIGWIGTGSRGNHVMDMMYKSGVKDVVVTAVCDTYDGHRNRAVDRVATWGGNKPKPYIDYRDLLADPSIDIVFICTPEHLHYQMAVDAMLAGKHIYLEKPLAHTIEEGEDLLKISRKSKRIVQVGTQNRSNSLYIKAKEMVQQGMIGEIHYVRAFWYRNSLPDNPAWRYTIPADADPKNTDWKKFLGSASGRPFDKRRYYQWRLYWDYSGGISTDLLVHQTDIANFVTGKQVPKSCTASGGIYRWTDPDDDRDVPDTLSALYEYPGNFHINYSCYFGNVQFGYGEQFMGNEGTIEVLNRQVLTFWTEKFGGKPPAHVAARKEFKEEKTGNDIYAVQNHVKNLIESVRGKEKLVAPVEVGQEAAISGHLATLSYRNNKKIYWDHEARQYHFA